MVDYVFYVLISGAGYISTLNYTSDVVIIRDPLPGFDPDYFVIISAVAICLVLFAAFPANYSPSRTQFFLLCFKSSTYSDKA